MEHHARSPESEDRPKGRNAAYCTEATYIKRSQGLARLEYALCLASLGAQDLELHEREQYEATMQRLHANDVRPTWARQP